MNLTLAWLWWSASLGAAQGPLPCGAPELRPLVRAVQQAARRDREYREAARALASCRNELGQSVAPVQRADLARGEVDVWFRHAETDCAVVTVRREGSRWVARNVYRGPCRGA